MPTKKVYQDLTKEIKVAVKKGNVARLDELLQALRTYHATDLLFFALLRKKVTDIAVVKRLLARGADLKARDDDGGTPLHWAAWQGSKDTVRLLITKGADLGAKEDREGWTPMHWTASKGHIDVVSLLIEKGAEMDAVSNKGTTPLYWAAREGHRPVAKLLIGKGADPTIGTTMQELLKCCRDGNDKELEQMLKREEYREAFLHAWLDLQAGTF